MTLHSVSGNVSRLASLACVLIASANWGLLALLIWLMTDELRKKGCTVVNAVEDADVDIVKAAVNASLLHTTTLNGEDTDLLVLLLYSVKPDSKCLYFRSDKFRGDSCKVYNIKRLHKILGNDTCSPLLFIQAMTGCDTTSRIFGVGKKAAFDMLLKGGPVLQSCSNAFTVSNQTTELIEDLDCHAMAVFFGGRCTDS